MLHEYRKTHGVFHAGVNDLLRRLQAMLILPALWQDVKSRFSISRIKVPPLDAYLVAGEQNFVKTLMTRKATTIKVTEFGLALCKYFQR